MKPPLGFSSWLEVQPFLKRRASQIFSLIANYATQSYRSGGVSQTFAQTHTLTRSTPRYVWDASGQLVSIAANQPCYEYDPATGEAKGLFLNPESVTNLLSASAYWWGGSANLLSEAGRPDVFGTSTATRLYSTDATPTTDQFGALISPSYPPVTGDGVMYIYARANGYPQTVSLRWSGSPAGKGVAALSTTEWTRLIASNGAHVSTSSFYIGRFTPPYAHLDFDVCAAYLGSGPSAPHWTAQATTCAADVCDLAALPTDYGTIGCFVINYSDPFVGSAIREMLGDGANAFFQLSADNLTVSATDGTNTASTSVTATGKNKVAVAWNATTLKICANGNSVVTASHNGNLGSFASPPRLARGVAAWYSLLQYLPSTNTGNVIATDAKMQELTA